MPSFVTSESTIFKKRPVQSEKLGDSEKMKVPAKQKFWIIDHEPAPNGHIKVFFAPNKGWQEAFIYPPHTEGLCIQGNVANNEPRYEQPRKGLEGSPTIRIGGKLVYLKSPILPDGNFTWNEATHGGTRIPSPTDDRRVTGGIIKIAGVLEEVRKRCGNKPIIINSWYRDPATNRRIGGASRSRHLEGDAVDFVVKGVSPYEVNRSLNPWWANQGGLASASVFTHIDGRGYKARWRYGF